jgi:hypothetical protein
MAITLVAGIALGTWARPWFNQTMQMTPANTNDWTRALTIIAGLGSFLALIACGWWAGSVFNKKGELD